MFCLEDNAFWIDFIIWKILGWKIKTGFVINPKLSHNFEWYEFFDKISCMNKVEIHYIFSHYLLCLYKHACTYSTDYLYSMMIYPIKPLSIIPNTRQLSNAHHNIHFSRRQQPNIQIIKQMTNIIYSQQLNI